MIDKYVKVTPEYFEIKIPTDTLIHALMCSEYVFNMQEDGCEVKVTDEFILAQDIAGMLTQEKEDGSTPLSDTLDQALIDLINFSYSDGLEIKELGED